jgi:hypothetical protein
MPAGAHDWLATALPGGWRAISVVADTPCRSRDRAGRRAWLDPYRGRWTDRPRRDAVIHAYVGAFDPQLRPSFDAVLGLRVLYECLRWQDEIAAVGAETEHGAMLRRDQLVGLRMMARRPR